MNLKKRIERQHRANSNCLFYHLFEAASREKSIILNCHLKNAVNRSIVEMNKREFTVAWNDENENY